MNQQILEKAIAKAIEGGWHINVEAQNILDGEEYTEEGVIFNHDFAKICGVNMKLIGSTLRMDKKC